MPAYPLPTWCLVATVASIAVAPACRQATRPETQPVPVSAVGQVDTTSAQDVLTEGRKIFHGQGLCFACHGGRLQGGPVAPPLAGPGRNPADTSFSHILQVIRGGSPHTPMVANQGGIDAGQMVQVANYVWAVSNGRSVP